MPINRGLQITYIQWAFKVQNKHFLVSSPTKREEVSRSQPAGGRGFPLCTSRFFFHHNPTCRRVSWVCLNTETQINKWLKMTTHLGLCDYLKHGAYLPPFSKQMKHESSRVIKPDRVFQALVNVLFSGKFHCGRTVKNYWEDLRHAVRMDVSSAA